MRISDWSSDVCSSDLVDGAGAARARGAPLRPLRPYADRESGRDGRGSPAPSAAAVGVRGVGADQDPARARTAGTRGMSKDAESRLLLVTGLSGAGKSTVLKVLEDLGWEVVDNLPLALPETLIDAPVKPGEAGRPLAISAEEHTSEPQS